MDLQEIKFIRDKSGNVWKTLASYRGDINSSVGRFDISCNFRPNSDTPSNRAIFFLQTTGNSANKTCKVDYIFVTEEFRRIGIGTWLLSEGLHFWSGRGVRTINGELVSKDKNADEDDAPAYKFWIKNNAVFNTDKHRFALSEFPVMSEVTEISASEYDLQLTLTKTLMELRECQNKSAKQVELLKTLSRRRFRDDLFGVLRGVCQFVILAIAIPFAVVLEVIEYLLDKMLSVVTGVFKKITKN